MTIGVSDGISFLVGVAVGAAGQYFADKYTDRRRAQEQRSGERRRFAELQALMLGLLNEMTKDFAGPDVNFVREAVLLPNQRVIYNSDHPVFTYFEDQHPNLAGQFAILENHGLVSRIGSSNTARFRISEELASFLLTESK